MIVWIIVFACCCHMMIDVKLVKLIITQLSFVSHVFDILWKKQTILQQIGHIVFHYIYYKYCTYTQYNLDKYMTTVIVTIYVCVHCKRVGLNVSMKGESCDICFACFSYVLDKYLSGDCTIQGTLYIFKPCNQDAWCYTDRIFWEKQQTKYYLSMHCSQSSHANQFI